MELINHLDKIKIKQIKGAQYIVFIGYVFDKKGSDLNFQIKINDNIVPFKKSNMMRKDVATRFPKYNLSPKCGFYIQSDSLQNIEIDKIELIVLCEQEHEIIYSLCGNAIHRKIETSTIEHNIDSITWESGDTLKCSIRGYAYSNLKGNKLSFKIVDNKNNMVDSSFIMNNREDIYKLFMLDENEKYCGFEVKFEGESNTNYKLVISNGTEEVSSDILSCGNKGKFIKICKYILKHFNLEYFKKAFAYLKKHGFKGLLDRLVRGSNIFGIPYQEWFEANRATNEELKNQKEHKFSYTPCISVIVPTFNTPLPFLREMIDCVLDQSYTNFQLCIADGSTEIKVVQEIKKYAEKDKRITYCLLDKNYGIAGNTNKALELATGDYVGLFDHDDLLTPDCLYEIVNALQDEKHDIIYTDEDKVDSSGKHYKDPNFKPDYNVDLFYAHNYITHFFVVKTDIIKGVGGFRPECDGAQDYDVMFRCIEQSKSIYHIPKILYHWRMHEASTAENPASKMYCYEAGKKAIEDHYERTGIKASVEIMDLWGMYHSVYDTSSNPLISIIIPNKDEKDTLNTCIQSLFQVNEYRNFEIIIVENNSREATTFDYYKEIQEMYANVKVVTWKDEFNYSAINNYGVTFAKGEFILLLNNDTEVINKEALSEMLGVCMRDDVGIVGAKLLYPDDTVQHAGIVIGFGGFAGHVFTGIDVDELGYMVRARVNCNYSAVTAACLMVKKAVFDEVHGLTEDFKVGLNDVDFCLKVRETGKLVVFNAFSLWHHYESKSRGYEDTPEKMKRFEGEIALFQSRWKDILTKGDPYYNRNFPIEYGPFKLG